MAPPRTSFRPDPPSNLGPLLAYAPSVHDRMTRRVPQDIFICRDGCYDFLKEVQKLTDSRGRGDKTDGRLYIHYIQPRNGYPQAVHDGILKRLGVSGQRTATPDDFVRASELAAFDVIAKKIQESKGELSLEEAGQILYIIGILIHAHQDRKHLEGNWTDCDGDGITSLDHFGVEIHQLVTDLAPSDAAEKRALTRTEDFLKRFAAEMQRRTGSYAAEGLKRIGSFKMSEGKKATDYRPAPQVMNEVFPSYATNDRGVESHWSMPVGISWLEGGNAFQGGVGGRWNIPFGSSYPRLNLELHLGGATDFSHRHQAFVSGLVTTGDFLGFVEAGVTTRGGYDWPGRGGRPGPFVGVGPALGLFDGAFRFDARYEWYTERRNGWAFSLTTDLFAAARLFHLARRDF